jgi:hypothetical protein
MVRGGAKDMQEGKNLARKTYAAALKVPARWICIDGDQ